MNSNWFVLNEYGDIVSIGQCEDFEDADSKAPNAIWIFSPEAIEDVYSHLRVHFI